MGYRLGVDIGTTYTAAAIFRDGKAEMLGLGNRAMQIPSVLFLKADGEFLVGEAAEARGAAEPERVAREFKRRIGDSVPILVGGTPFAAEALTARLLSWVVAVATERQGEPPETITVSHPANWGGFKMDLLRQSFLLADLADVRTCTEPEAAAVTYATRQRVAAGECIAVYDLGGGTFDAAVLRNDDGHFTVLGAPEGIEHLGGVDFDEALFQHVLRSIDADTLDLDPDDPDIVWALQRLRRECVEAKELLSADTETVLSVVLGTTRTSVRLTRGEFEDLLRPTIEETIGTMRRVLRSAGVEAQQLSAFVLVGGSSRIPLVSEILGEFGRPLAMDTHPKHDIALGAALLAGAGAGDADGRVAEPIAGTATVIAAATDDTAPQPLGAADSSPRRSGRSSWTDGNGSALRSRRGALLAAAATVVVAGGAVAYAAWPNGAGGPAQTTSSTSPPPSSPSPSSPASSTTRPAVTAFAPDVLLIPRQAGPLSQIWSVKADGTAARPLTDGKHDDGLPAMSHNRTVFAYVRTVGRDPRNSTVRLLNADGTNDRELPVTNDSRCPSARRPAFSPNGTELAAQCYLGTGDVAIYLASLSGRLGRLLVRGDVGDPTFSTDGRTVAFWQRVPGAARDTRLAEVATSGGSPLGLTAGSAKDNDPAWSPDGRFIAFRRTLNGNADIGVYDVRAKTVTRLTFSVQDEQDPSWSPDGTQIAYKYGPTGRTQVWVVNADGTGKPHAMFSPPPGITPDTPVWTAR